MRRVPPAPVEADREGGRVVLGGHERRLVLRVRSALGGRHEAGAQHRAGGPARVRASDVLPDRQAARGDHGRRPRDVHDQADELVQRGRRLDVPAGFDALRDQDVGAVRHRLPGAGRRADLHRHSRARVVATGDALASGLPPRERQHGNAERQQRVQLRLGLEREHEVGRERTRRERAHARDHAGELAGRRPGAGERAQRARLAHGRHERRAGTATDGRLHEREVDAQHIQQVAGGGAAHEGGCSSRSRRGCERGARFEPRA